MAVFTALVFSPLKTPSSNWGLLTTPPGPFCKAAKAQPTLLILKYFKAVKQFSFCWEKNLDTTFEIELLREGSGQFLACKMPQKMLRREKRWRSYEADGLQKAWLTLQLPF